MKFKLLYTLSLLVLATVFTVPNASSEVLILENNSYVRHSNTIENLLNGDISEMDIYKDYPGQQSVSDSTAELHDSPDGQVYVFDDTHFGEILLGDGNTHLTATTNLFVSVNSWHENVVTDVLSQSVIDIRFELSGSYDLYLSNEIYPGAGVVFDDMAANDGEVSLDLYSHGSGSSLYSLLVDSGRQDFTFEQRLAPGIYDFRLIATVEKQISGEFSGNPLTYSPFGAIESFRLAPVATVPVPPALILLLSGLFVLTGVSGKLSWKRLCRDRI